MSAGTQLRPPAARRVPHPTRRQESVLLRRSAGVVFLLVPALLAWLAVAIYAKTFVTEDMVTVLVNSAGNEMHPHADVKLHGVVIGEVRKIESDGDGARLTLAIDPAKIGAVPADVTAELLPTTLFGQRYVALIPPLQPSPQPLAAGAVIGEDRSQDAVELDTVLNNTLPLLTYVQPQKISETLTAVAQALQGRGTELGTSIDTLNSFLQQANPDLPAFNQAIKELVQVSQLYANTSPAFIQALTDFTKTSSTIAQQQANLGSLYGAVTTSSNDLRSFLLQNENTIIQLSGTSTEALQLLAKYSPSFPCTLRTLAAFVPEMDRVLGKGTNQPGMHVKVNSVPSLGKYLPGRDTPNFGAGGGPACYPVPYTGAAAPAALDASVTGVGLANSPQENELVNELVAPSMSAQQQQALPDWSSVLVGPALRGTEVKLG